MKQFKDRMFVLILGSILLVGCRGNLNRVENENTVGISGGGSVANFDPGPLYVEINQLKQKDNALIARLTAAESAVGALQAQVTALQQQLSAVQGLTTYMSVGTINANKPAVFITGANLVVRNGSTGTETKDGTGNLIVGHNEATWQGQRGGSHNLIVGSGHQYDNYGGLVAGKDNIPRGPYALIGGYSNYVGPNSSYSSVLGGQGNMARGPYNSIVGGNGNETGNAHSVAVGGYANDSIGPRSVVVGGNSNSAWGDRSVISGGSSVSNGAALVWKAGNLVQ